MADRVSDLSVEELRTLIQDVVRQTIKELSRDPDAGSKLRAAVKSKQRASAEAVLEGGKLPACESTASQLGLSPRTFWITEKHNEERIC